jgi:hypothetical protein
MSDLFELTLDRRAEREDRRKRDIPVAVDRRTGDRRHLASPAVLDGAPGS